MTNILAESPDELLSRIFRSISSPVRIRILEAIGDGEACVCHLEALLGLRQAYISQQLMDMREAGLLKTRREGRYIFYSLTEPHLLSLLNEICSLFGISEEVIDTFFKTGPVPQCCCPHCSVAINNSIISENEISA